MQVYATNTTNPVCEKSAIFEQNKKTLIVVFL